MANLITIKPLNPAEAIQSFNQFGAYLQQQVLRGSLREGAKVTRDAIKASPNTPQKTGRLKANVNFSPIKREGEGYVTNLRVSGQGAFVALFLERGTKPHLITTRRFINSATKKVTGKRSLRSASGIFFGRAVRHKGQRANRFFYSTIESSEVASDRNKAIAAYIARNIAKFRKVAK